MEDIAGEWKEAVLMFLSQPESQGYICGDEHMIAMGNMIQLLGRVDVLGVPAKFEALVDAYRAMKDAGVIA